MKKALSFFLLLGLLLVPAHSLSSQELEAGYFLGGNPYAFRLNPAFQSERTVFSIGLGGTGLGVWSNVGVSTFLYPDATTGELYTFMSDRVSNSEFLRKISRKNHLDLDANVNLLTLGFWSGNSFYTLDVNVKSLSSAVIPYDGFSFLKEGTASSDSFDLSNMGMQSHNYIEAAFGWSRNFDNDFNVGVRVKGIVAAMEAEALLKKARLTMNQNRLEVNAEGQLYASSPSFSVQPGPDGYLDLDTFEVNEGKYGPAGYGGALDLGVSWNVLPELTLSAAVLDLGMIRWNREIVGYSPASYSWEPSSSDDGPMDEDKISEELEKAMDALLDVFRFQPSSEGGAFEMLPLRYNVGVEYRMPFYDRLSVGALLMGRTGVCYARNAGRVSLNWNPLDFLSFSASTTVNRLGESLGFALNLHPGGLNLLLGADYIPLNVVRIDSVVDNIPDAYRKIAVVPANQMKMNLYVGLNFAFGHRRLDHAKRFIY